MAAGLGQTRLLVGSSHHRFKRIFLGVVVIIHGLVFVVHARRLTEGDAGAWRHALWASGVLLLINIPLTQIQAFALDPVLLATINIVSLWASRKQFGQPTRPNTSRTWIGYMPDTPCVVFRPSLSRKACLQELFLFQCPTSHVKNRHNVVCVEGANLRLPATAPPLAPTDT